MNSQLKSTLLAGIFMVSGGAMAGTCYSCQSLINLGIGTPMTKHYLTEVQYGSYYNYCFYSNGRQNTVAKSQACPGFVY